MNICYRDKGEMKTHSDKQIPRGYIPIRDTALQHMLKQHFQMEKEIVYKKTPGYVNSEDENEYTVKLRMF